MSRYQTACVLAFIIGLAGVMPSYGQDAESTNEPVDIRPPATRAKLERAQAPKPVAARLPAKPKTDIPEGPLAEAPKPLHAAAPKKNQAKGAPHDVSKPRTTASKSPASVTNAVAAANKSPEAKPEGGAGPKFDLADQITTTAGTAAPKPAPVAALPADFCTNIADLTAESRAKIRAEQLAALEADLRTRISELEAKKVEVQGWVEKQEEIRKRADESVLAILGKMKSESAAAQIALMEDAMAAAVLMKLGPKPASAILNDMGAAKAARITESMMAQRVASRTDGVKSAN